MKYVLGIWTALIICAMLLFIPNPFRTDIEEEIVKILESTAEKAYFVGQIDYAKGIIRIEKDDTGYIKIEAPWSDGKFRAITPEKE